MACLRTADDIKQLGTILFVAAHPDDESFLAGGILAAAVANGQTVVVYTATRGEAGVQDRNKCPRASHHGIALGYPGSPYDRQTGTYIPCCSQPL
jgi:hypothetical protein